MQDIIFFIAITATLVEEIKNQVITRILNIKTIMGIVKEK